MGDLSNEPSMEEILSSIKRIIAEEGETPNGRPRRSPRAAPAPVPSPPASEADEDEVLELSHPIAAAREPEPQPAAPETAATPSPSPEPIMSEQTAQAARGALGQLSRLLVKPEPGNDGTLEGLVREMLRPMLREWLDAYLPRIVEDAVAREIAKITGLPPR